MNAPPLRRGRPIAPPIAPPNAPPGTSPSAPRPLTEAELDRLQQGLDALPAPLEPLDTSMLDGYLCGVLVQPTRLPFERWWRHVPDVDGRPVPAGIDTRGLQTLARRRHAELDAAIEQRRWFDPWVFEWDGADNAADAPTAAAPHDEPADGAPPEVQAVYPWVAGFVTALELFPGLMAIEGPALNEALVLLYRHLDADDLEDADEILEAIEALEPPEDLGVAVEELVRATLLLADIGRPLKHPAAPARRGPARPAGPRRR